MNKTPLLNEDEIERLAMPALMDMPADEANEARNSLRELMSRASDGIAQHLLFESWLSVWNRQRWEITHG